MCPIRYNLCCPVSDNIFLNSNYFKYVRGKTHEISKKFYTAYNFQGWDMIHLISLKCYQIESNLQRIFCPVCDVPSATRDDV